MERFETIDGINLNYTKYFVLSLIVLSQFAIIGDYAVNWKKVNYFFKDKKHAFKTQFFTTLFPLHFGKLQSLNLRFKIDSEYRKLNKYVNELHSMVLNIC